MNQAIVTLKNGAQASTSLVAVTMISLRKLLENERGGAIAFYELVEKCRKPDHKLWGSTGELLGCFMDGSGQVQNTLRSIILAASEGEGLDLKLVSPVEPGSDAAQEDRTPEKPAAPEIDVLVAHFRRLRPIVEFVVGLAHGEKQFGLNGGVEHALNPCFGQTRDLGVVLCQYYSGPSGLMTPLGFLGIDWTCAGYDLRDWREKVDQRLGLKPFWGDWTERKAKDGTVTKVFDSKFVTSVGELGPGWTVLRDMDGKPFEETKTPILGWFTSPETERLVEYEEAKKLWDVVRQAVYPDSKEAIAKAEASERSADEDREDPRVVGCP